MLARVPQFIALGEFWLLASGISQAQIGIG
jgi:hypothetical protein